MVGGGGADTFLQTVWDSFGTVAGGRGNTAGSDDDDLENALGATVGGGGENTATGRYATVPGGQSNVAAGDFSLAAGRRAFASDPGSFVWADSTDADFGSTAPDQFAIRAGNGVLIAEDAGSGKAVPPGTRYRDNSVVAWARVAGSGALDGDFNVASVTRVNAGHYRITLATSLQSGFSLVPAVTPEVDGVSDVPQTGAANVRFAVTNQFANGSTFDVFMYNGSFALVDNDFHVLVVGR